MSPPAFTFKPEEIPDGFVWDGQMQHMTYPDWVPPEEIFNTWRRATSIPPLGYSISQEEGDETPEENYRTPYKHTHVAVIWQSRIRIQGSRKFDIFYDDPNDPDPHGMPRVLHPHILPKLNWTSMEQCFHYHTGWKLNVATHKMEYKKPHFLLVKLPPSFEFSREIMTEMCSASSLREACVVGNVRPKSVTDVAKLREDSSAAPKRHQHKYPLSSFKPNLLKPGAKVQWMYGGSGYGKTKRALADGDRPFICKPFDSVACLEYIRKRFDPKFHDVIVFDEADLRFLTRTQAIALLDQDEDCVLSVRFTHLELGADVRKIFVSNPPPEECWPADPHGAIRRRIDHICHVTEPCWLPPGVPGIPAPLPQPAAAAAYASPPGP